MQPESAIYQQLMQFAEAKKYHSQQDNLIQLCDRIGRDPQFQHVDADAITSVVNDIARQRITDIDTAFKTVQSKFGDGSKDANLLDQCINPKIDLVEKERATASQVYQNSGRSHASSADKAAARAGNTSTTLVDRVQKNWKSFVQEEKMVTGMNFLVSGLFAASAFGQLSKGFAKDDNGERHVQPTQLGIGIVLTLLAAGSAYLGAKPLMAATR